MPIHHQTRDVHPVYGLTDLLNYVKFIRLTLVLRRGRWAAAASWAACLYDSAALRHPSCGSAAGTVLISADG